MKTSLFTKTLVQKAILFALALLPTIPIVAQTPTLRANGKIAFTSDRDGNREIYVMNADGTNQVRLTNNSVVDDHPTWSPDGTKIAFVSQRASGGFAIFVMNADGTSKVEITPIVFDATYPIWDGWGMSWSPDGSRIVFQEKVEPSPYPAYPNDIFIVNIDGSDRHVLINGPDDDRQPSWSPDGSRILFGKQVSTVVFNLFTVRPDGSDLQSLAGFSGETDLSPTWSPTGEKIAFQCGEWVNLAIICIANADGSDRDWFEYGNEGSRDKPDWSPDGSKIVFHVAGYPSERGTQIYVKNVDGTGLTRLTNLPGNNFNPSWQPLAPAACPNPIDCADFFIRQQYRDFLGRESEEEGLRFYLDILDGCHPNDAECINYTRAALSANFFRSPEFRGKGNFVLFMYMVSLGQRPVTPAELSDPNKIERPVYQEFLTDLQSLSDPTDDPAAAEQKKVAFADAWMQRPEIIARYGNLNNSQFIQKLFETAGLTIAGQDWGSELNSGSKTRAQVVRQFAERQEVYDKFFKQAFVTMEYFGYLRRTPEDCHDINNWGPSQDPSQCGYIFHNNRFNTPGVDPDLMQNLIVRGFIESPEYRTRF